MTETLRLAPAPRITGIGSYLDPTCVGNRAPRYGAYDAKRSGADVPELPVSAAGPPGRPNFGRWLPNHRR